MNSTDPKHFRLCFLVHFCYLCCFATKRIGNSDLYMNLGIGGCYNCVGNSNYLFLLWFKGDEASLQMALNMVHKNRYEYVAVLFYASWCQFSKSFRPSFSILSSLYPSIPHFAIQESAVRPRFHIELFTFSIWHSMVVSCLLYVNIIHVFLQHTL